MLGRTLAAAFVCAMTFAALPSCSFRAIRSAGAEDGAADLSAGIDFDSGEIVRLDGFWEFRDGALVPPGGFAAGPSAAPTTAHVPGTWRAENGFERKAVRPTGAGTLRLRLKLPARPREWAIRLPNADSSVKLFIDGTEAAQIGTVAETEAGFQPSNGIAYPHFRTEGGAAELIMQVANFAVPYIGTWDSPLIGTAQAIESKSRGDMLTTAIVSGALLIMGLYHLSIFLLRREDKTALFFGLICLLMTTRNLIMGERILLDLFPTGRLAWEWAFKIEHLSAHLTVPFFALFFRKLYPRQVRRLPVAVIVAVGGAWAALILSAPALIYQRFLHWYEFFLLGAGVFVLGSLVAAAVKRERDAGVAVFGLLLLLATAANDVLLSTGIITRSVYLSSYGVFLYIFIQSFHLSMLFSRSFREVATLSLDLSRKNRELESLHTIDLAIASSMELDKVLSIILQEAVKELEADAADVLLLDHETETLSIGARLGFRTDALLHTKLKAGQGFAGRALESDETIFAAGLDRDAAGFSKSPAFEAEGFLLYAGRRLTVKGKIVGVIELYRRGIRKPSASWDLFFKTLAGQAAIALDNSALLRGLKRANEELAEANEATIEGWAEALELRDRETEGHSRRVTEATLELAGRFGIAGNDLVSVRHGALLHDIGKMGIPDAILLKPGPLDAEEFAVMKKHPEIARDLLSRLRFLDQAMEIPYGHHEKWDGSGYPRGLAGEAIPLSARLFAVVDVWDALRSDRPYRQGWPEDKVLAHLAEQSGTHFAPDAVAAFIALRSGKSRN